MKIWQIELYNKMVEEEGTETEEAAKKAYRAAREESNDTEEKTVDAKVSSALINRVRSSFSLFLLSIFSCYGFNRSMWNCIGT